MTDGSTDDANKTLRLFRTYILSFQPRMPGSLEQVSSGRLPFRDPPLLVLVIRQQKTSWGFLGFLGFLSAL